MLQQAKKGHYAVPHFNINNLEWTKYILEECQTLQIPVILGVSEGAARYMGGFHVVTMLIKGLVQDLGITIPVCIHLDHGKSVEVCVEAIRAGFTSVMIDASMLSLEENITKTKQVVDYAKKYDVTVEAEIGRVGGSEDGVADQIYYAKLEDCKRLYEATNIDSLAPALGSVHGLYHGEPKLDFETMKQIDDALPIPLVLHGGTGIPAEQIQKAIFSGISKININTELQITWSKAVRNYLKENDVVYDPRKIIGSGELAMKKKIREIVQMFQTR